MSTSDWTDLLSNPEGMRELYTRTPTLPECFLFYFHIDERESGITLGFDTRSIPDRPRPEWLRTGFNAFEFFLTFAHVTDLSLSGWNSITDRTIDLSRSTLGGITARVTNSREMISFHASSARLSRARVYLASSGD
ncbi:Imm50 family immunity protein [Streptomyces marianii]|uniref:Uncharacterized protein n=1 Tax=Streptomyces marianii TaxID=1817406 RepID=A0A5R9E8G0_9ACTN|nr:Imm50 family immunity protein [Streptomyces marianii]TLQ45345.1 hypothetical protein FEF34_22050 [Streptomyces marianii]